MTDVLQDILHPLPLEETVAPAEASGVADLVRNCAAVGRPVYPLGGGTQTAHGLWPTRPGLGLSLTGLRRVVDHAASDMTITVEAGVTFSELSQTLRRERQWLPVDVALPERATVGGLIAANWDGPRRFGHGGLRDFVLGLTAVDGQGMTYLAGGRVVKNSAGINLQRLLTGSLGTLGVITQATLMVRPLPEATAWVVCPIADVAAAEPLLAKLMQSRTLPAAVELLVGDPWRDVPWLAESLTASAWLLVCFEGAAVEVDWMLKQLADEWRGLGAIGLRLVPTDGVESLWRSGQPAADVRISVLPGQVVPLVEQLRTLVEDAAIQAHAGNGIVMLALSRMLPARLLELIRYDLRPLVASLGGTLLVLRCPVDGGFTAEDMWGPSRRAIGISQAIRERFDPAGVLNPGRFAL